MFAPFYFGDDCAVIYGQITDQTVLVVIPAPFQRPMWCQGTNSLFIQSLFHSHYPVIIKKLGAGSTAQLSGNISTR